MTKDEDLLRTYCVDGDDAAFAQIVQHRRNMVFGAALRKTGSAEMAEDITQAVFLLLAQKANSINECVIIAGWLFKTTQLVSISALRRSVKAKQRELAAQQEAQMSTEYQQQDQDRRAGIIDEALNSLGAQERDAVILRYLDGLSIEETAATLRISPVAAQKRASRGIDRIRRHFAQSGTAISVTALAALISEQYAKASLPDAPSAIPSIAFNHQAHLLAKETLTHMVVMKLTITAACVLGAVVIGGGIVYSHAKNNPFASPKIITLHSTQAAPWNGSKPTVKSLFAAWKARDNEVRSSIKSYQIDGRCDWQGTGAFTWEVRSDGGRREYMRGIQKDYSDTLSYDGHLYYSENEQIYRDPQGRATTRIDGSVDATCSWSAAHTIQAVIDNQIRLFGETNFSAPQNVYSAPFNAGCPPNLINYFEKEGDCTVSGPDNIEGRTCYALNLGLNHITLRGYSGLSVWFAQLGPSNIVPIRFRQVSYNHPATATEKAMYAFETMTYSEFASYGSSLVPMKWSDGVGVSPQIAASFAYQRENAGQLLSGSISERRTRDVVGQVAEDIRRPSR